MIRYVPVLLSMAIPFLGACQAMEDAAGPDAELLTMHLTGLTADEAECEAVFQVRNPYSGPMVLAGCDYLLRSAGTAFLSGRCESYTEVPPGQTVDFHTSFAIPLSKVKDAMPEVRDGQVVPFHAAFQVLVTGPARSVRRIPAGVRGELPLPAPLRISLLYVLWEDVTEDSVSATLYLDTFNPNEFEFFFTGASCTLSFSGEKISDVVIQKELGYPAGGARKLNVPLSFFPTAKGIDTVRLIAKEGAEYALRGTLTGDTKYGTLQMPVDATGKTRFRR